MTLRIILIIVGFSLCFSPLQAQESYRELMKMAKEAAAAGDHYEANRIYRKILTLDQTIPSEFCYYFAETLYHIGQYRNSRSFIDKYVELVGNGGEYASEIARLRRLVDEEMDKIMACSLCDDNGYRLETCHVCEGSGEVSKPCQYCRGGGALICDLCSGDGVIVRKNVFNINEYHTCTKCSGTGATSCPFCQGKKTIVSVCQTCAGNGKAATETLCDHKVPAAVEMEPERPAD